MDSNKWAWAIIATALLAAPAAVAGDTDGYHTHSVPDSSALLPGRSLEQHLGSLAHAHLDAIEGVWHYAEEMTTVAVERFTDSSFASRIAYRIVLLESEDFTVLPGTVMGYIADSADPSKFEMWLYSERRESMLHTPVRLIATLNGSTLTFKKPIDVDVKVRVNLARFLPSLFRGVVATPTVATEQLPVGLRRIYPTSSGSPNYGPRIRYL